MWHSCRYRTRRPAPRPIGRRVPDPVRHVGCSYNSGVTDAEGGAFELGTDGPKVILAGVDDSVTSMRAAAYAAGLARRQGARLVCVYVARPSAVYGAAAGAGASAIAAQEQALHETATDLRREAEEGARRPGLAPPFSGARREPHPHTPARTAPHYAA